MMLSAASAAKINVSEFLTLLPRAGNGTRTRDPNLGKVVLYQLSYSRERSLWTIGLVELRKRNSNRLPATSFPTVEARGIEPLTS